MNQVAVGSAEHHETGRETTTLGLAVVLSAAALDVWMSGRLTMFFDLSFVALCLGLAALVRRADFFVVALLPPLLMIAIFAFVALVDRGAVADPRDNLVQAVISGVATHGVALFSGYALCLGWLGWRLRRDPRELPTSPTSGSSAGRRTVR